MRLRDWSLQARRAAATRPHLPAERLRAGPALRADPAGAAAGRGRPVAQGPDAEQASYYYSEPQLAAQRPLALHGRALRRAGHAPGWTTSGARPTCIPTRSGWDWIGMNLDDGGALMAFRMRRARRLGALWAGGSLRSARRRRCACSAPTKCASAAGALDQPAHPRALSGAMAHRARRRAASPCRRCSTTRSSTAAARPAAIYWEGLSELLDAQRPARGPRLSGDDGLCAAAADVAEARK